MGIGEHHPARRHLCARARRPSGLQGRGDGAVHLGADRDRRQTARRSAAAARTAAEAWLFEHLPKVRRATPDAFYNDWTHAYSIQALVRMLGRKPHDADRRERIRALIEQQIGMLGPLRVVDGGWAYYDFDAHTQKPSGSTISFVTAAVLVALHEARQAGVDVPQRLIDRAMASIRRQRKPDFSYIYGEYLEVPADACRSTGPAAAWAARRPATWPCGSGATSR